MARSGWRHSNIGALLDDGRLSYVGENIAWARGGGVGAGTLHTMWMQSPDHRDNMMSPSYNVVGIGIYCGSDGKIWATQDFGRLASSGPGSHAPAAPAEPFVRRGGGGPGC
jgi:uncharacterized protein YkwD